jgi:hypothetical protein
MLGTRSPGRRANARAESCPRRRYDTPPFTNPEASGRAVDAGATLLPLIAGARIQKRSNGGRTGDEREAALAALDAKSSRSGLGGCRRHAARRVAVPTQMRPSRPVRPIRARCRLSRSIQKRGVRTDTPLTLPRGLLVSIEAIAILPNP